MKNIKTVLIVVGVVLAGLVALSVVGLIMTLVQYVFWLGVVSIAGFAAVKFFNKSNRPQLESKSPVDELETAGRTLEEYKRKYLLK